MKRIAHLLVPALLLLSPVMTFADESQSHPADNEKLKIAKIAPADDAWRASLPRDPEAATNAYLARISPEAKARSDAYFEGGYWLQLWEFLFGLLIGLFLLKSKLSAGIRTWTEGKIKSPAMRLILFSAIFLVLVRVLSFPVSIYTDFFREHQYGLSNLSFGEWLKEWFIGLLVGMILGAPALAAVYGVIRKFPKRWPVGATLVGVLFLSFASLIGPVYIDPLFNHYTSLEAGPTKDAILSLARANGVPATDVYQFDASKQSDRVSANVSGFMNTTSIRLNDNLLRRSTPAEIKGVMGHEMGHYVLNHVYKGVFEFSFLLLVLFWFLSYGMEKTLAWKGGEWDLRGVGDIAGVPLFMALMSIFFFFLTPVTNTLIRTQETEADMYGLNAAREPDAEAEVDLKLTEYRKPDPGPVEEFIFFDHPSTRKRVYAAMRWKAENWKAEEKKVETLKP